MRRIALGVAIATAGCGDARTGGMDEALADYEAGRYSSALTEASDAVGSATGEERYEAAYVAGLSAYRLGRMDEAADHFAVSAASPSAEVGGRSKIMQGQILLRAGRPRDAAVRFADAALQLEDADARRAAAAAADAYAAAGDAASAARWRAMASADREGTRTASGRAGSPVAAATRAPFTLQVGAFAEQRRARKAARDVGALARRHGYGPVRVVPTLDARGRPMYLVQFGAFGSRQSAAQARSRVGRLDFIVAAADD